jgi:hypothetical protein
MHELSKERVQSISEVLKEIQSQCGNCQISFPKQETGDKMITIRGPKNGVEDAKKRIQQIVDELVKKFDHKIIIPVSHKKTLYLL